MKSFLGSDEKKLELLGYTHAAFLGSKKLWGCFAASGTGNLSEVHSITEKKTLLFSSSRQCLENEIWTLCGVVQNKSG